MLTPFCNETEWEEKVKKLSRAEALKEGEVELETTATSVAAKTLCIPLDQVYTKKNARQSGEVVRVLFSVCLAWAVPLTRSACTFMIVVLVTAWSGLGNHR